MGVRTRVTLVFAIVMALFLSVAGVFMVNRLIDEQRSQIDQGLRARATSIVRDVEKEFGDVGKPDGIIDETEVYAQVVDRRVLPEQRPASDFAR